MDDTARAMPRAAAAGAEWRDVVIVGGGFGGLACARALGGADLSVMVVDRRNHHLFQPLLYQVATAALSPADIAEPIRRILGRYRNVDVIMAELAAVDPARHTLRLGDGTAIAYGRLVIATGSEYDYFGHDDWKPFAPGLKSIDDARAIRSRVLRNFEEAEACRDPRRQKMLMTTVVVGGGPTGVEMAGALAELARFTLARDFRHVDPTSAVTLLVEAGPRLLSAFPETLSAYAARELARLGVTVVTGRPVEAITAEAVTIGGERVEAGAVVWGAGIRAAPATALLGVPLDRAGRLPIGEDLAVAGLERVHAIGDAARLEVDGRPLPALAQVAKQQGEHLGRAIRAAGREPAAVLPPFRFRDRGNTAVIGRHAAVFDFGRHQLRGTPAWLLWALVHVYLLVGFQKRLLVSMQWLWRWATYQRGARIIR